MITIFLSSKIRTKILRDVLALCVIVLIASLLGFLVETIWVSLRHGYIDNRGMHMPFLLGYGLANLVVFLIFGAPDHPHPLFVDGEMDETLLKLIYIFEIFLFITICESAFGNLIYRLTSVKWWNYNSLPLHIGQYTSIPTSIGFTTCIYIFLENVFVPMYDYLTSIAIEQYADIILLITLFAVLDCTGALLYMLQNKSVYTAFRIQLQKSPSILKFIR